MNNHFTNMRKNTAATIPPTHLSYSYAFDRNILNSFVINEINENEVIDSINCLRTKSTYGLHEINSKFIKLSKIVIITILTKLYNKCIKNETFSKILKQSPFLTQIFLLLLETLGLFLYCPHI